ncbi:MAG: hypothetical protein M5U30_11470 [Burkholderiaceae bacterium]|nr:hypothetical protein [Burkholderiaceae bacterium]
MAVRTVLAPSKSSQRYFSRACFEHDQACRGEFERLARLLADRLHAGELRALDFREFVLDANARQILRQRRPATAAVATLVGDGEIVLRG